MELELANKLIKIYFTYIKLFGIEGYVSFIKFDSEYQEELFNLLQQCIDINKPLEQTINKENIYLLENFPKEKIWDI